MALENYLKDRRRLAVLKAILTLIVLSIVWVVFLKAVLISGETKLEKAERALKKKNWEEVDYQYRHARKRFAFYLKIFVHLPEEISITPVNEVEKLHEKADSGVNKVIMHYQAVKRKNEEIDAEKARIRENYRNRLISGEVSPTEDEYVYSPDKGQVDEVEAAKAPDKSSPENNEGKWMDDINSFDEYDDNDDERTKAANAGSNLDPDQEEGKVKSSQPSWITK